MSEEHWFRFKHTSQRDTTWRSGD